jgi:hypothetical protein
MCLRNRRVTSANNMAAPRVLFTASKRERQHYRRNLQKMISAGRDIIS